MELENILGKPFYIYFLIDGDEVIAYSWHRSRNLALNHLRKIIKFHNQKGKIVYDNHKFRNWLNSWFEKVVYKGERFHFNISRYNFGNVYRNITDVCRGCLITYAELARRSNVRYVDVLRALMNNPYQVLIPCHRIITKKRTLMGFYPLGKEVKRGLLQIEGIYL